MGRSENLLGALLFGCNPSVKRETVIIVRLISHPSGVNSYVKKSLSYVFVCFVRRQGLTSTVIGIAVLGMVGAAAANLISAHRTADSAHSASADAAAILDTYASEIRNTTPYHEIEHKFGTGGGYKLLS